MWLIAQGRIRFTALKLWSLWVLGKGYSEVSSVIVFVEWPWDLLCSELHMAQPFDLTRFSNGWQNSESCAERVHHWQTGMLSVRQDVGQQPHKTIVITSETTLWPPQLHLTHHHIIIISAWSTRVGKFWKPNVAWITFINRHFTKFWIIFKDILPNYLNILLWFLKNT